MFYSQGVAFNIYTYFFIYVNHLLIAFNFYSCFHTFLAVDNSSQVSESSDISDFS